MLYFVEMQNGTRLIVNASTESEAEETVRLEIGFHAYGDISFVERLDSPVYCLSEVCEKN